MESEGQWPIGRQIGLFGGNHPNELLTTQHLTTTRFHGLHADHEIIVETETRQERRGGTCRNLDLHAWLQALQSGDPIGQHMCRPILDASDAKGSRDCFASGYRDCFLAKSQQAARVAEQQFALGGEANRMARPDKERLADSALEALDLQAYRRLAPCKRIARRCEAAALGYGNKRLEEVWLQSWQFEISMTTIVKIRFDNSCHIGSFASSWMRAAMRAGQGETGMDDHIRIQDEDHRVAFDFEIEFSNGGGLKGWDFRLDIDGPVVSDEVLGDYIVKDLRLLMVGSVKISNKKVFKERHKRTAKPGPNRRGRKPGKSQTRAVASWTCRIPFTTGRSPTRGCRPFRSRTISAMSAALGGYAEGVSFQIGRIDMVANSGTSIDAPYHRFPGTPDVAALPLASMADLQGVVVRLAGNGREGRDAASPFAGNRRRRGQSRADRDGPGPHDGEPRTILQAIPISRTTLPNICATAASLWSASTASISTTPAIRRGQLTACCSRPASRSSKTSPIFTNCLSMVSASRPYQCAPRAWEPFPCERGLAPPIGSSNELPRCTPGNCQAEGDRAQGIVGRWAEPRTRQAAVGLDVCMLPKKRS